MQYESKPRAWAVCSVVAAALFRSGSYAVTERVPDATVSSRPDVRVVPQLPSCACH
ncbi:hypothetical protein [Streptomyces sp. CB03911]|uniref:hypothetical protein n=1 Tax=Streptomyces sp. CB03911 TaxID=1804758 RepID=UPI0018FE0798|nr:hypothetical protein [Streptomyces sp. CB03911]